MVFLQLTFIGAQDKRESTATVAVLAGGQNIDESTNALPRRVERSIYNSRPLYNESPLLLFSSSTLLYVTPTYLYGKKRTKKQIPGHMLPRSELPKG